MTGIPGNLYGRLQATLLRCGPFNSDRALRPIFIDARLSAWRDYLPEAGNRVERVQAIIETLSDRTNPAGENALVLFLRVLADRTPPGDACHGQLASLAQETTAALRAGSSATAPTPAQPTAGTTLFNQQGQHVDTQINVAGNYYAAPQSSTTITGDGNVIGDGNTVHINKPRREAKTDL